VDYGVFFYSQVGSFVHEYRLVDILSTCKNVLQLLLTFHEVTLVSFGRGYEFYAIGCIFVGFFASQQIA
jgi:hypothetical protein